jgi:hypothetical protein
VATNRETIEIALSGLEKLNQLERTLKGLETYADNVADAIGGIQSRIDELSGVAGRAATRARSASVAARAIGGVVGDKSFGRGPSGGETLKNRNRLKKIAASVDLELQQSRTVFREAAKARRALTPELEKLGKAANQNAREQARVGAELTEYRKTVRSARERILAGVSELGAQARGRSTNILRSRYRTQRNRLSSGPELSGELAKQAEELERKFESTEKRLAQLDRAERALNRTVRAANPEAGPSELRRIIGRERGAIASSRRATVTEQGRLLEQRREIGRVSRGRRLVGAQSTILRERISGLERAGVTPGRLKADIGGQSVDLETIIKQASQAANLAGKKGDIRGNVERAKTLLEIAKNQVGILERELTLTNKVADAEQKRASAIQKVTDILERLRTSGASGSRMQAFEQLATQLRGMSNSKNMPEFDRVLRDALAASARVAQPKGFVRGPASPLLGKKFIQGSPKNIAARETALLQIEEFQQRINKLSAKGAPGEILNRATDAFSRLASLASSNNFRQFDQLASNLQRLLRIASGQIQGGAGGAGNRAKAEENVINTYKKTASAVEQLELANERAANRAAGLYDDSDLKNFLNGLYQTEEAAKGYLDQLDKTFKLEDARRKANEKGAAKTEQQLDRENGQMLAIEKRQRKLAELRAAGVAGPAIQRAQSLVERLPELAAQGAGGAREFRRVERQAAQALGFATPGRGAGAGGGRAKTPEQIARNFARELSSAQVAEQNLIGLSRKNVDASSQLVSIQGAINQAKKLGTSISEKDLEILKDQVATARDFVKVQNAQLANAQKGSNLKALKAASESRLPSLQRDTLTSGLIELGRADTAAKVFRGGRSGEQALSNIINAFNKTQQTQATRGSAARPADERTGVEREIDRYKQIFAGLTSNPRFYGELLSKLPREAITTTMAGAATEREASIRRPGLSVFRPGGGPGDLEGQILSEYQKVFGTVPSGVKQLFDKIGSVFDAIVGRPSGGGGGGRPPIGPGGPSGPGDFGDEINSARGNTQRLLGLADIADMSGASIKELQLFSQALSETREGVKMTDASFNQLTKAIDKVDDRIARTDPDADLLVRRFGRRGGQAVGEGLIGGAFPLLFGQGGGAALGGGVGGFLGGFAGGTLGFGLSLAGTAIGSQVDALAQAAQDTGNLLRDLAGDVSGSFEKIKESGLFASRGQEKLVSRLLEAGDKTAAYAIIQGELNKKIGAEGAAQLKAAADAGDRMKRAMADLSVQMQIFIAGPLTDLLNKISAAIEGRATENRVQDLLATLPQDQRKRFQAELSKEAAANSPFRGFLGGLFGFNAQRAGQATGGGERSLIPQETLRSLIAEFSQFAAQGGPQSISERSQETIRNAESRRSLAQAELDIASKAGEPAEILKGFKQQATAIRREQEDIDRQSFELRRDYEKQIEDIRRGVEDRITQIRQENAQKELEIVVKQGQIREASLKNANALIQASFAGDELASSLSDAVSAYLESQLSAQNQIEQRRRQFEIEVSNRQVEIEKYKAEVARNISRLNIDTAQKVAEINRNITRRNEDAALNNFETEKKIASLRIRVTNEDLIVQRANLKADIAGVQAALQKEGLTPDQRKTYVDLNFVRSQRLREINDAVSDFKDYQKKIEQLQAPPRLTEIAPVALGNVNASLGALNSSFREGTRLLTQFNEAADELDGILETGRTIEFVARIQQIALSSGRGLINSLRESVDGYKASIGQIEPLSERIRKSFDDLITKYQGKLTPADVQDLKQLRDLQIRLKELEPTIKFYTDSFSGYTNEIKGAKEAIVELLAPTSEYEKALRLINKSGGLSIDPKIRKDLLESAKELDNINAKLKALRALKDVAGGITDSFIEFNKQLLTGQGLTESLKGYLEGVANKTLGVLLEFTLRPLEEALFKNLAGALGFEIDKEDPLLKPLGSIEGDVKRIADSITSRAALGRQEREAAAQAAAQQPAAQMPAAQLPANGIVPGPGAMAQRQGYPEYIDKSVLRNWLISQGMGRTSGDFTNAGHRTPNHMLNAMDMGFIDPKYDSNYVQKTKEMEAKLRATGAFGNQLFGPTSDPGGHGTHLHIPTPGGRVKVTPGLAQLMGLGQPMQQGQTYPSVGNGQPEPESPVAPAANQAAESLGNLDQKARQAAEGVTQVGTQMSDSVSKFQQIVGTGLQAITSVAMGIGGAQMIRKGGTYNTLMGAASIFGSISSLTGMFGTGGPLSGLFGSKAPSATASNFMMPQVTGVPGGLRALGGPVFKGEEYLVGEEGPEVIRMGANGTVIPTDELYVPGLDDRDSSSAPPIGRYARRSNASSDMADGDSERSVYGDTYERGSSSTTYIGNYGRTVPYQRSETSREIDRLERVTSSPSELPPIKYETTRVNEYDFVTPEQLEASNARTAKVARNQTIRELADSLKTRKRLGL